MSKKTSLPTAEAEALKILHDALEPFRAVRGTMPLQYVTAFCLVGSEENQNVSTYALRAGTSQSLMTRHLSDLGDTNRYHEEGMGLLEGYDDLMDRRNRLIRLSPKGKTLAWKVAEALSKGRK